MQLGAIFMDQVVFNVELPHAEAEVLPGVLQGAMEAFPTPAYWVYQVYARRLTGNRIKYKFGTVLKKEVGTYLPGGYDIPASVGIAAFHHLRERGAFGEKPPAEEVLIEWLLESIAIDGRQVRYRFAKQKARYLSAVLQKLTAEQPSLSSGKEFRDQLLDIPGIGYKTTSWVARNWLDTDNMAILDIHILRADLLGKFFGDNLTVEHNYLGLEEQFIRFSKGLGVGASELGALMQLEMVSSPSTVHSIMGMGHHSSDSAVRGRTKRRKTNSDQLALIGQTAGPWLSRDVQRAEVEPLSCSRQSHHSK